MMKLPVAGRVKTRLAREVGIGEATRAYRATALSVVRRLANQPFWKTALLVTPDHALASPMLPKGPARMAQGPGDLGRRMQRPMAMLPPGPVCVIGTDIPGIGATDVRRAFRLLGRCDAVFGPAADGGFWLVGLRRRPRLVWPYTGVQWSRPDTLASVRANLEGMTVGTTTVLSDIDDASDLHRWRGQLGRVVLPCAGSAPGNGSGTRKPPSSDGSRADFEAVRRR